MKRVLGLCLVLLLAGSASSFGQAKKRVALIDFDYGSVQKWWDGDWDVGKGIVDMITTSLVKDGTFSVIERKNLDAVLHEQNFSNSDRANPTSAAKIGKILGVNAIIVGTVTQFGLEDKSVGVGGFASRLGGFGGGRVRSKSGIANVAIDARLVDVNTGEVLAVGSGKGTSKRSGLLLGGSGGSDSGSGGGGINMQSSNFQDTILGEATRAAVDSLVAQLVSQSGKVEATQVSVEGLVADASGGEVIINIGKSAGVTVGVKLSVERVTREVKDPTTGKLLRKVTSPVGEIVVTQVEEGSAVCKVVSGQDFKVGDMVKSK